MRELVPRAAAALELTDVECLCDWAAANDSRSRVLRVRTTSPSTSATSTMTGAAWASPVLPASPPWTGQRLDDIDLSTSRRAPSPA